MSKKPTGIELIAKERKRQISKEGYDAEHDDQHTEGQLAAAAAAYCMSEVNDKGVNQGALDVWPWDLAEFKNGAANPIQNLVKAGALVAAEIDRLQRIKP